MANYSDLIGIPYKDGGRDRNGADCYGIAIMAAERAGYALPDVAYTSHDLGLSEEYAPTLPVHRIDAPREGAIIEMETGGELHIGIAINGKEFIHATRLGSRINRIGAIKVRAYYGIDKRI